MLGAACSCFRVRCYKWCPNGNCGWRTFLNSPFYNFQQILYNVGVEGKCQWITRAYGYSGFFLILPKGVFRKGHIFSPTLSTFYQPM